MLELFVVDLLINYEYISLVDFDIELTAFIKQIHVTVVRINYSPDK